MKNMPNFENMKNMLIFENMKNTLMFDKYEKYGNRSKAHRTKAPDNKPPGLLKRLLRNMPMTLTCSDYGPPILKKNPTPDFFFLAIIPGAYCRAVFLLVAFVQGLFVREVLT